MHVTALPSETSALARPVRWREALVVCRTMSKPCAQLHRRHVLKLCRLMFWEVHKHTTTTGEANEKGGFVLYTFDREFRLLMGMGMRVKQCHFRRKNWLPKAHQIGKAWESPFFGALNTSLPTHPTHSGQGETPSLPMERPCLNWSQFAMGQFRSTCHRKTSHFISFHWFQFCFNKMIWLQLEWWYFNTLKCCFPPKLS